MCHPAVYLHRWDSFPPELLRRVASVLLRDWAYFSPDNASDCLRPIRATCTAWRSIIDADVKQLTVTVPSLRPAYLAENFPNATHLDLSRYHLNSQDIFSVLEQLKLRSATSFPELYQTTNQHTSCCQCSSCRPQGTPAALQSRSAFTVCSAHKYG